MPEGLSTSDSCNGFLTDALCLHWMQMHMQCISLMRLFTACDSVFRALFSARLKRSMAYNLQRLCATVNAGVTGL